MHRDSWSGWVGAAATQSQRASRSIAYQREAARQHPAVGKCRQQLGVALAAREAGVEQIVDGADGALGERSDAFAITQKAHPVRSDVGGGACPQSQRKRAVALAPALDLAAQEMSA